MIKKPSESFSAEVKDLDLPYMEIQEEGEEASLKANALFYEIFGFSQDRSLNLEDLPSALLKAVSSSLAKKEKEVRTFVYQQKRKEYLFLPIPAKHLYCFLFRPIDDHDDILTDRLIFSLVEILIHTEEEKKAVKAVFSALDKAFHAEGLMFNLYDGQEVIKLYSLSHRRFASRRTIMSSANENEAQIFFSYFLEHGYIKVDDVSHIKEEYPFLYQNLVQHHIYSFFACRIRQYGKKIQILTMVNYDADAPYNIERAFAEISPFLAFHFANYDKLASLSEENNSDYLTGLYNRYGFHTKVQREIATKHLKSYGFVILDVDDFKFVNDLYGHLIGDQCLINLAKGLKRSFPDATIGRIGGDEYCLFFAEKNPEEVYARLNEVTSGLYRFNYQRHRYSYTTSCGMSFFPEDGKNPETVLNQADLALYAVKTHGKGHAMRYNPSLVNQTRSSLGFSLKDISDHVPGAILIYRNDRSKEILYADKEMIALAGCKDFDDFKNIANGSFRNLVYHPDYARVKKEIQAQLDAKESQVYVDYRIRQKDGTIVSVEETGRLIESRYGPVFYIILVNESARKKALEKKKALLNR